MSIKLSPKHGVNTTISHCFWCGKPKNEIVFLGKINRNDDAAPNGVAFNYDPCDECKTQMNAGITLIGVVTEQPPDNRPPIQNKGKYNLYPTGTIAVITEDAVRRLFIPDTAEQLISRKKAMLDDIILRNMLDNRE